MKALRIVIWAALILAVFTIGWCSVCLLLGFAVVTNAICLPINIALLCWDIFLLRMLEHLQ